MANVAATGTARSRGRESGTRRPGRDERREHVRDLVYTESRYASTASRDALTTNTVLRYLGGLLVGNDPKAWYRNGSNTRVKKLVRASLEVESPIEALLCMELNRLVMEGDERYLEIVSGLSDTYARAGVWLMPYPVHVKPQVEVPTSEHVYRVDIMVDICGGVPNSGVSPCAQLIVECDGARGHSTPEQIAHDRERDHEIERGGWVTVRHVPGREITRDPTGCALAVFEALVAKFPQPEQFLRAVGWKVNDEDPSMRGLATSREIFGDVEEYICAGNTKTKAWREDEF